ncbi:hypothetical protein GCS60_000583 [Vibrio metschnikovii]|nr:hypothetical protein [Vibrio metschnikovii]
MCNCLDETLLKIKEKVIENIANDAELESLEIGYQNKMIRFDGKKNDVMLGVKFSYFKTKKGGERYKNRTKDHISLAMSYCPMCGEKYE